MKWSFKTNCSEWHIGLQLRPRLRIDRHYYDGEWFTVQLGWLWIARNY